MYALVLWLCAMSGLVCAARVQAAPPAGERALIAPRSDAPREVPAGGTLSVLVEVATGLTPPPGVQEDRALRLFSIALCADGVDLGAGARRCFPLAVRNLRPEDGASLRYRVEAPLPVWVAPWLYDLELRFPGGQVSASGAVRVPDPAGQSFDLAPETEVRAGGIALPGPDRGLVRVHVGGGGLALSHGRFAGYPLADPARGFASGIVALVRAGPGDALWMTKRQEPPGSGLALAPVSAQAGRPVKLTARGVAAGTTLFWWLDAARGARGNDVTTVFLLRGSAPLQLLAIAPDGRFTRAEQVLPIWQRRAFGCTVSRPTPTPGTGDNFWKWFVFLLGCCVWRGASRSGARFAIAAPRRGDARAREARDASGRRGRR